MKRPGVLRRNARLMRRSRLAPVSKRRRELMALRRVVVARVMERDGYRCQAQGLSESFGGCFGRLTAHEIVSRARSGRDANLTDPAGMLVLCAHHNDMCEDHPLLAWRLGLVRHSWEQAS